MTDKVCSFVDRTRFCEKCGRPIRLADKYQWHALRKVGHYALRHRDCKNPERYPRHD